ncbi:MAG: proline--tRNA ligase [Verrucomicrobiae bacterium]|nr:proline--tRNA ligase [Verrucomicrobiae bacterium]
MKSKINQALPDRTTDMSAWYQEVIARAELAEHAPVKGCMVIRPYGYAIWEFIQSALDARIKARGVSNTCFPMLIPESYLSREKDHVEGFAPEVAVVTYAGGEELQERLIVRPTSETIVHESMSRWINSYRDLPLRINQWGNVVRWEKRPRLFLRNTEFLWQEGHTAHATEAEARQEVAEMVTVYYDFASEVLAMPTVCGVKSEKEKFAGAVESHSIEGLMPDGKGLQMGTIHYLGENFSRMASVTFLDKDGEQKFVHMTSWGVSTRLIGALIMVHGDDRGLVLPPEVAPSQVVIVPVAAEKDPELVMSRVSEVAQQLRGLGLRVQVDDRDGVKPGAKFYQHEMRGVPLRIEIGPRDAVQNTLVCAWRFVGEKEHLSMDALGTLPDRLSEVQRAMLEKTSTDLTEHTISVHSKDEFIERLNRQDGFISARWCGSPACEKAIKEETSATIRNMPYKHGRDGGVCIWCDHPATKTVIFSKAY